MPSFADKKAAYGERIATLLERTLPRSDEVPERLHEALRYAELNGGKRIRPLLVYAAGETLGVDPARLDPPAIAIELIHAFSLVHDDLPAMDDDDLRRGQPTVHRKFDEATAILAADALQPLAFGVLAGSSALSGREAVELVRLIAAACGSRGMTGGQSIDLWSEGRRLDREALEQMHRLKTGALIHASVMAACCLGDPEERAQEALDRFGSTIGLAFQVQDDILDVEGETRIIGKRAGADQKLGKATWPALFGIAEAKRRCRELLDESLAALRPLGARAGRPAHHFARSTM